MSAHGVMNPLARAGGANVSNILLPCFGVGACQGVSPLVALKAMLSVEFLCPVQSLHPSRQLTYPFKEGGAVLRSPSSRITDIGYQRSGVWERRRPRGARRST